MEEAMPARCGGAPLMIAAEAATMTMPRPAPARTRPGTTHAGLRPPPSRGPAPGVSSRVRRTPRAPRSRPPPASGRTPVRWSSRRPHADGQEPAANAVTIRPACRGVRPRTSCSRWVRSRSVPAVAAIASAGRNHPGAQAPVAEQGEVDQRVGAAALTACEHPAPGGCGEQAPLATALTLTEDSHQGREYVLTGDEALTVTEQVRILSAATGLDIKVREPTTPEEAVRARSPTGHPRRSPTPSSKRSPSCAPTQPDSAPTPSSACSAASPAPSPRGARTTPTSSGRPRNLSPA